jgi:hypothetical protein
MHRFLRSALFLASFVILAHPAPGHAQSGILDGQVVDRTTRTPLFGAVLEVLGGPQIRSALSNAEGRFRIRGLEPGVYSLRVSTLGYAPALITDLLIQSSRPTFALVEMRPTAIEVEGITIGADAFAVPASAPVSTVLLSPEEVRRTPGGLQDISRTLLSLPGVIGGVDNRNDLLVRGGGPGENAYFLDGIRVPQINHFATQGATGGALGLVNVDFIRETEFYTGGFPARYGDALSSVLVIDSRPGTPDGIRGDVTLGASEAGLTLDGPVGAGSWLFSVRRSYLQFLFQALGLPIRPDYWDGQARVELFPSDRDRLVFMGLGALDEFDLVSPDDGDFENQEIFDRVLDNDQKSWTAGGTWERQLGSGVARLALSRSWTDYQFRDVDGNGVEILRNRSTEAELPVRFEADFRLGPAIDLEVGVRAARASLDLDLLQAATPGSAFQDDVLTSGSIAGWRTGGFAQTVIRWADERATLTAGTRIDRDPLLSDGLSMSPRLGLSVRVSPAWTLSTATGVFHQSPSLLSLAVREDGALVNRGLRPIRNVQGVLGVAWRSGEALRVKAEGFVKHYDRYPVLRDDPRISLANLGGDYGFIGGEPLVAEGEGRAFGVELFAQQKLTRGFYLLGAYTWSRSEFTGSDGTYRPSSWDVRHALDLTAGLRLGSRWELGTKWRLLSGRPFTPFDEVRSAAEYEITGRGVPDWDRIGVERTPAYVRLDFRAERSFDFGGWNGRVYLDVQNLLNQSNEIGFNYTRDPALPDGLRPIDGTGLLPFFGFSVEF